jgi:hypothetical protein
MFTKVFDVVWLSFMTVWTFVAVVASIMSHLALGVIAVGAGAFFWAIGFHSLRGDWRLADEVFDAGDTLLVRKGSAEARIAFSDIRSIDERKFTRSPRVLLNMIQPNLMGSQISFIPRNSFRTSLGLEQSIADSLRARVSSSK